MNDSPENEAAWEAWVAALPKPELSPEIRARSLAAAMAAFHTAAESPRRRWVNVHTLGWAACWLIIGGLWASAPSTTPPAHQRVAQPPQPPFQPSLMQETEMATLLAMINRRPESQTTTP